MPGEVLRRVGTAHRRTPELVGGAHPTGDSTLMRQPLWSGNLVPELAGVVDAHVDPGEALAGGHAGQALLRQLGQERAGQDVIDVAGAALHLLAAPGDAVDHRV